MKKLLLGSISLFLFALAIVLVQISCQKTIAQINSNSLVTAQHLLLYHTVKAEIKNYTFPADDTASHNQTVTITNNINTYFISDIDRNNEKMIPISLPAGMYSGDYAKLTDDGTKLVFSLYTRELPKKLDDNPIPVYYIYSCNVDGTDLKKIKESSFPDDVH